MPDEDDEKIGREGLALMRCFLFELDDIARVKVLNYAKDLSMQTARRREMGSSPATDKH